MNIKKIVYDIVMNAKDYLEESGKLFLVIRKEQGAKSLIKDLEKIYDVEILEKKKGFYIFNHYLLSPFIKLTIISALSSTPILPEFIQMS